MGRFPMRFTPLRSCGDTGNDNDDRDEGAVFVIVPVSGRNCERIWAASNSAVASSLSPVFCGDGGGSDVLS